MIFEFSVKLLYSTMYGKKFSNLWKMYRFEAFLPMPLPTQDSLPSSCHHVLGRKKLLIPPGSIASKICFPQQQKGVEETMICFIKIQSQNVKMTWNIRLLYFSRSYPQVYTVRFFICLFKLSSITLS